MWGRYHASTGWTSSNRNSSITRREPSWIMLTVSLVRSVDTIIHIRLKYQYPIQYCNVTRVSISNSDRSVRRTQYPIQLASNRICTAAAQIKKKLDQHLWRHTHKWQDHAFRSIEQRSRSLQGSGSGWRTAPSAVAQMKLPRVHASNRFRASVSLNSFAISAPCKVLWLRP